MPPLRSLARFPRLAIDPAAYVACPRPRTGELELELILSQMAQKPMLRGEVGARALRVRSDVRGHGQVRLCKALGCGRCGCLKPIRACWKQFMMCLEGTWFVAAFHSTPMHDAGPHIAPWPRFKFIL